MVRKQNYSQDQKESKDADDSMACEHTLKEYRTIGYFGEIEYKQCTKCKEVFISK